MNPRASRRVLLAVLVIAVAGPIAVMFWNAEIGAALLILGLFIAAGTSRALGTLSAQSVQSDPEYERLQQTQAERGRTIYVQLTDDAGNELPPEVAQQKMDDARRAAGPRDMVIPVRAKGN